MLNTLSANGNTSIGDEYASQDLSAFTESELAEAVRQGEEAALLEIMRRYSSFLRRVVLKVVDDEGLAEDLLQETFLRMWTKIETFDSTKKMGPWLAAIAQNLALDTLRKKHRRISAMSFDDASSGYGTFDPMSADPRDGQDSLEELNSVLVRLGDKYRLVLVMYSQGYSTSEIARKINREEATVRWRLNEAREQFKILWNAYLSKTGGEAQLPANHL